MADYLEAYAKHFNLPVRTGISVERLSRDGARYIVEVGDRRIEADHVVVAMATYQAPRIPEFAQSLDPAIAQLHSSHYKNPGQLKPGDVLVVGAGNSGADIAVDVSHAHRTCWQGVNIPFHIEPFARLLPIPSRRLSSDPDGGHAMGHQPVSFEGRVDSGETGGPAPRLNTRSRGFATLSPCSPTAACSTSRT